MGWVIFVISGVASLLILFVVLTDGRYFGKGVMHWVYDCLGPMMFGAQSEAARWRSLSEKVRLRGNERVLDVGTAVGDLPLTLVAMPGFRGRAVGVDWSQRMIEVATEEAKRRGLDGRVEFRVVDIRAGNHHDRSQEWLRRQPALLCADRPGRVWRRVERRGARRGVSLRFATGQLGSFFGRELGPVQDGDGGRGR
ncbi:MAG TPA: methyltransferase domain-containing protein [Terriglobales bacterium]|nr:methyltransferase domain-containing protein [Terriglobales bacterium]